MYVRQNKNQLAIAYNGYAGFGAGITSDTGKVTPMAVPNTTPIVPSSTFRQMSPEEMAATQAQKDAASAARGGKPVSLEEKLARTPGIVRGTTAPPPPPPENNTTKYLIAGGIATVLILGVLLLKK